MIRPIVQLGAPILKAPARPLERPELAEEWALSLMRDMFATLEDADGVGLSATRVGVSSTASGLSARVRSGSNT